MTETIFEKNLSEEYFSLSHDLYCSQPAGGDQDVLASLLGSSQVVHLLYSLWLTLVALLGLLVNKSFLFKLTKCSLVDLFNSRPYTTMCSRFCVLASINPFFTVHTQYPSMEHGCWEM